mmetsp:Transcript_18766/g.39505  ORF Transcript_18766/g.39505 Transcript_18766/m.39505 type:complete len:202 (+) Transcript_18766:312-917(+)
MHIMISLRGTNCDAATTMHEHKHALRHSMAPARRPVGGATNFIPPPGRAPAAFDGGGSRGAGGFDSGSPRLNIFLKLTPLWLHKRRSDFLSLPPPPRGHRRHRWTHRRLAFNTQCARFAGIGPAASITMRTDPSFDDGSLHTDPTKLSSSTKGWGFIGFITPDGSSGERANDVSALQWNIHTKGSRFLKQRQLVISPGLKK